MAETTQRTSQFEAALAVASRALAGFICHHAPPCQCTTEILRRAVGDAAEKRGPAGSNQPGCAHAKSLADDPPGVVISFDASATRRDVVRMRDIVRRSGRGREDG